MKQKNTLKLIFLSFLTAIVFSFQGHSQTVMAKGDMAIISISTGDEQFAFVTFVDLAENTVIYFTDEEADNDLTIGTGEGTLRYTVPAGGITKGTVISYTGVGGAWAEEDAGFALGNSGDGIIAYQGTGLTVTTFLHGVGEDAGDMGTFPAGTLSASDYVLIGNDDGNYTGTTTDTAVNLFSAINTPAQWTVSGSASISPPASFTVNDPAPTIGFDAATSNENETNATFSVNIPITVANYDGNQIDISIAVTGGTAEMADYTLNTTSLSFTANGSQNVSLDINSDAGFDDETVILTLTETSSVAGLVISQATHTVTINDDESAPTIGFDSATSGENETDATFTSANIPITVSNYSGSQIDINVNVTGGTAEGGDYTFTSPTALSFTGNGSQNITMQINDDADADDETVILTITETSSVTGLVISQATHTVTITDDETPVAPTTGTVFISEVSDASSTSTEYIEIYNNSTNSISMNNAKIVMLTDGTVYDFGTDFSTATIPSRGFLIVTRGANQTTFEAEFGTLNSNTVFVQGTGGMFFGAGTARRWQLYEGGTANTADGTLIDDTGTAVAGNGNKHYQNIFTDTFVSDVRANATPGTLEYLVYVSGGWVNSTALDGTTGAKDAYLYDSFTVSTSSAANAVGVATGQALTINAGVSLTANGDLTNNGTLTINSDATSNGSLIVAGTSSGDITYNRYVTFNATGTLGWHLVGSPVEGETVQDIITNGSLADGSGGGRKGLASYDNNQDDVSFGSWVYTTGGSTGTMNSGVGYSIKRSAAGTIPFTGTLKTDDLSTYAISVGTANSWNLIGNPYPSFININTAADLTNHFLTTAAISQLDAASAAVYVWDSEANSGNGGYIAINNSSGASYLAPGQGFFLSSKAGGGTIDITVAMQTHQSGDLFLRSATIRPEITLQISDGTFVKSTEIKYIDDNVSTGLDPGYDAKLFDDTDNSFAVYTHLVSDSQGLDFMLQAIPNIDHENMIIPIGVNAIANSEITFTATSLHIPNGLNVFLEDKETNTFTRLDEANAEYKVTLATDLNGIGRFYLHMNTEGALSTGSFLLDNVSIYKTSEMNLRITGLQNENTSLRLYDILGKQVLTTSFVGSGVNDIPLPNIRSGVYIIQLQTDQGKLNKKIVIE